jgi:hypothetical protein
LQRLSSSREEQVGQKREWCSVASEEIGQVVAAWSTAAAGAEVEDISKYYCMRDFFKVLWFKPRIEEGTVDR